MILNCGRNRWFLEINTETPYLPRLCVERHTTRINQASELEITAGPATLLIITTRQPDTERKIRPLTRFKKLLRRQRREVYGARTARN